MQHWLHQHEQSAMLSEEDKKALEAHFDELERRWIDRSVKWLVIFSLAGAVMLFWTALR